MKDTKIRVGVVAVETLLNSKIVVQNKISYTIDTFHLLAENTPADAQNKVMINQLNTECVLTDKSPIKLAFPETDFEFTKKLQNFVLLVIEHIL